MDEATYEKRKREMAETLAGYLTAAADALAHHPRCREALHAIILAAGALGALHGLTTAYFGRYATGGEAVATSEWLGSLRAALRDVENAFAAECLRGRTRGGGTPLHGWR